MFKLVKCLLLWLFILSNWTNLQAQELKIAAIDWCPQICPTQADKGYVVDITEAIFADSQYAYSIEYYPWSRAIKGVTDGSFHILLSPAKSEAPELLYPSLPIGNQQMCFFTKRQDPWVFTGASSLNGKTFGIAQDTSIASLNSIITELNEVFQFQPYHERFIKQNAGMVMKGRLNGFIFTKNTTLYTLKQLGVDQHFKQSGCVSKENIYTAFTSASIPGVDKHQLVTFVDARLHQLVLDGTITKIKSKYGIE